MILILDVKVLFVTGESLSIWLCGVLQSLYPNGSVDRGQCSRVMVSLTSVQKSILMYEGVEPARGNNVEKRGQT